VSEEAQSPFEKPHAVALYKSLKYGWVSLFDYYGEKDVEFHSDSVRISEPVEVMFRPLENDAVIQGALKTLDEMERQARIELEKKLAEFRNQRASLMALTHQKEAA